MYLFFNCQTYNDCGIGFEIEFWFVEGVGVIGVDSEQYDTYLSKDEIEKQEPSHGFDFYHHNGSFRVASLDEIIEKDYLAFVDGFVEIDDKWVSGLKLSDYAQGTFYFEDEKEKSIFLMKLMGR